MYDVRLEGLGQQIEGDLRLEGLKQEIKAMFDLRRLNNGSGNGQVLTKKAGFEVQQSAIE